MSQRIIGITGGIGTGKTTVSDYLKTVYKIPILDADDYAREAVQTDSPILQAIKERYGKEILNNNGGLNRSRMGEIIFNNPQEKQWLEKQIHPYVRHRIESNLSQITTNVVAVVIPLLFEAKMTDLVTEIWVVSCSPQQQLKRLIERDHLSETAARSRIKSQMSLPEKIAFANVVIDNSLDIPQLHQQIDQAVL